MTSRQELVKSLLPTEAVANELLAVGAESAYRVLGDKEKASDVAHGVIETLLDNVKLLERIDNPAAYVKTAANRRACNIVNRDKLVSGTDHPSLVSVDDHEVESTNRIDLNAAFVDLTDAQREAIDLIFVRGHTYREAADVLGITYQAVHSRVKLALRKLTEYFDGSL